MSPFTVRLLSVMVAASLLATACGGDSSDGSPSTDPAEFAAESLDAAADVPLVVEESTSSTTSEPTGFDPTDIPGEPINMFNLETGDCFDLIEDLQDGRPNTITTRLPCGDPHSYEIFATLLYPAVHPSIYPGETIIREFALTSCYREFESWVGEEYEVSALEIDVIIPPQANFEDDVARYRGIHCWVERVDGESMTGTSRQSGW